eukprot:5283437-Pyramimonas_sp.AAC.1
MCIRDRCTRLSAALKHHPNQPKRATTMPSVIEHFTRTGRFAAIPCVDSRRGSMPSQQRGRLRIQV